ncbi:MAG: hypothetical protein D6771_06105, partial [Zetaproteobacteria bacterium]
TKGQPVRSALGGVQAALRALSNPAVRAAYLAPANSDYARDKSFMYVDGYHGALAFQELDAIECYMDHSGAEAVLNKARAKTTYMSFVNYNRCSAADTKKKYVKMEVDATPFSAGGGKEIIRFWIDRTNTIANDKIVGEIVATQGESAATPFGVWTMKFWGMDAANNITGKGVLIADLDPTTGKPRLRLYEGGTYNNGTAWTMRATVVYTSKVSGYAKVEDGSPNPVLLAFDGASVLAGGSVNPQVCYDRTQFDEYAMLYRVYDAQTGNRVRFKGLPAYGVLIKYTTPQGTLLYDWASPWGVWGQGLTNGMTVQVYDPAQAMFVPMTAKVQQGVLLQQKQNGEWVHVGAADLQGKLPLAVTDNVGNPYTIAVSANDSHLLSVQNANGQAPIAGVLTDVNGTQFYWDPSFKQIALY